MTQDLDWAERLMKQLDKDQPLWAFEWASQSDLQDYVSKGAHEFESVRKRLRERRISQFHRIINAALSAGLIKQV